MTVNELAKAVGVQAHVVRYYVRIGLLEPQRNPSNQYKIFGARDVRRLRVIREGQQLGFTLAEIRSFLRRNPEAECIFGDAMRELLSRRVQDTAKEIEVLRTRMQRMMRTLAHWERNGLTASASEDTDRRYPLSTAQRYTRRVCCPAGGGGT